MSPPNTQQILFIIQNPHVAPYIRIFSDPASSGILSKIAYLIKSEVRHRLQQAYELGFFRRLPALSGILAQSWEGDITIGEVLILFICIVVVCFLYAYPFPLLVFNSSSFVA